MAGATNAKVPWGAAGAAGGSVIGSALADIINSLLTKGMGLELTEKNLSSVEILVVAALAYGGSYLVGYFKGSGQATLSEQVADVKEAKEIAKEL
jgi:hypothetical protein